MKQSILFCLSFLLLSSSSSHEIKPFAIIELDRPELYLGMKNPITIKNYGISAGELKVTCQNGKITRTGRANFTIQPSSRVLNCEIEVKAKGKVLEKKSFATKTLPYPRPAVGSSFMKNNFKPEEFKHFRGLSLPIVNADINTSCKVEQFALTRISETGERTSAINKRGSFKDDALKLVQQAKVGDIYIFEHIVFQCPGHTSTETHWANKVIYIK